MLNKPAPNFSLPSTGAQNFNLGQLKGSPAIIYFYPRDHTSGCTTESMQFRDYYSDFKRLGYKIFGVSRDTLSSHEKFKQKLALPFELLADTDETVCKLFDVMKMKNMYGKKVRGIERSTFVIDKKGVLVREWRRVKVPGHVEEVLQFVKNLNSKS